MSGRRVAAAAMGAWLLCAGTAWGVPRLDGRVAASAHDAAHALRQSVDVLRASPGDVAALRRAEHAMHAVEGALDAYFHASNLRQPAARPAAARIRALLHEMLAGDSPLLLVHEDVLSFRPALHRELAAACERQGDTRGHLRHLRAALAVEIPTLLDLATLRSLHGALGEDAAAEAVAAEIARLRTASLP